MKQIFFLLVILVALGVYRYTSDPPVDEEVAEESTGPSAYGFVPLPVEGKASGKGIVVMAALNCPEDAAQRADYLAKQLEAREHRVALVEVVHVRLLAECVEQPDSADAEHDLLRESILDAAAVQTLGDPAIFIAFGLE